jgi:5'-3' exonuclease
MGIPSYFSHLVKNYRNVIDCYNTTLQIDNILLDCNSIIYDVYQTIDVLNDDDIEKYIIENVYKKIINYIQLLSPKSYIYIAFDGVAPIAKLEQQRNRRYKTQYENNLFKKTDKILWDKAAITPGTKFMNKLNKYIKNKTSKNKNIIFSGSDQVGEGEHKMFQYIRDNPTIFKKSTTIIYGLDADLIMLSLIHNKYVKDMYLFRETPEFIKSIDKTLEPNKDYLLNISNLKNIVVNELSYLPNITNTEKDNIIEDYIFICFLLGNDFLPHFPSLNIRTTGINTILTEYQKIKKTNADFKIIKNNTICWKNLKTFILNLSIQEFNLIKSEYKLRDKRQKHTINKIHNTNDKAYFKYLMTPILDRRVEEYININEPKWEFRYYKILFDIEIDDIRKKEIALNYIEGLEWVYKYYTNGCCDWRWKYKYNYPPLLTDLVNYIPYFNEDIIKYNNSKPIEYEKQLVYVLPSGSINLLPKKVLEKISKYPKDWYNYNNEFQTAFCTYMWESHAILPHINIDNI